VTARQEDRTEQTLRRTLEAVAPVDTQLEADFADLMARLSGSPTQAPVHLAHDGRRPSRMALVAAAAALVIGVAAVAVATARDRSGTNLATVPPAAPATGWYVPRGLGDDWILESVDSDFRDVEADGPSCPCRTRVWVGPAGETSVVAYDMGGDRGMAADQVFDPDEPVRDEPLGTGVTATVGGYLRGDAALWLQGGRRWFVSGVGVSNDEILKAARALASDPDAKAAPLEGFDLMATSETPGGLRSYHAVHVVLRNKKTGNRVAYVLAPPGRGEDPVNVLVPHRVPVNPELPWGLAYPADPEIDTGTDATRFLAHWPGADVNANGDASFGEPTPPGTEREVRAVLGSLRSASAAEWDAFLQTATGEVDQDPALDVPSLTKIGS
jgi:hypothetical protein